MALTVTPSAESFLLPTSAPQVIQIAGGIAPYTAISSNTAIATVSSVTYSGANLLVNAAALTGWTVSLVGAPAGSVSVVSLSDPSGVYYAIVALATASGFGWSVSSPSFPVTAGVLHTASFNHNPPTTHGGGNDAVNIVNASGGANIQGFGINDATAYATRQSFTFTPGAGITNAVFSYRNNGFTYTGTMKLALPMVRTDGVSSPFVDDPGSFTLYPVASGYTNITVTDSTP
jgi:hypothetical protein